MFRKALLCTILVLGTAFMGIVHARSETVRFAVFPSNDPAKLQQAMDILAAYLGEQTGDEVLAVVTRDYEQLVERLRNHTVDIAWTNTSNYVRIMRELPNTAYIATYVELNDATGEVVPYYHSYIIALKHVGPESLEQAQGMRFAFTDIGSTSGYSYPRLLLASLDIDPETYFSTVFFLGQHDRVIEALLARAVDLGAVSDGTYAKAVLTHGDLFNILARSDPIPLDAIVASDRFPGEKVREYREAFVSLPQDHAFCEEMRVLLGWSAAGFEVLDPSFYDTARQALEQE